MPDVSKQPTDPRVLRTRQLIKDAFIDLLQEMDIEKMSISRIAERATINRVTFYLHYRDIPDMLEKMADDMIEDFKQAVGIEPEKPATEEEDWSMMLRLLEHIAEHHKFYKVILGSRKAPIFSERLLNMLTELISARIEEMGTESFVTKQAYPRTSPSGMDRQPSLVRSWPGCAMTCRTHRPFSPSSFIC